MVEGIGQLEIRELIEGNYRIVYRIIDKEKVHILLVHHGARDLTKRLES
ncbi:type II toxin-antitoxin system RelE/ParE family toxin [Marivirga atlantica]